MFWRILKITRKIEKKDLEKKPIEKPVTIKKVEKTKLGPTYDLKFGESDYYDIWIFSNKMSDEYLIGTILHEALHNIAYNKIEDEKLVHIRERIQNILYGQKDSIQLGLSAVFLGQNYFIIADLLGHPIDKVTKRRFDNVYDFATFKIVNQNYKLFFKNKVLIDIERP